MFVMQPRGRHRAPNKLTSSFNSTARVSAAVAVGGGLVASAAFSSAQAADSKAATGVPVQSAFQIPGSALTPATAVQPAAKQVTQVTRIAQAPQVRTQLASVVARTYRAPKPVAAPAKAPATQSTHTAVATSTTKRSTSITTGSDEGTTSGQGDGGTTAPAATGGVIAIAKRYLGVPYVYGGSTPSGFDCSGFTGYVYRQLGISLPRSARAQQAGVPHVSSPQPGDLVFFGTPAHHVGIYLGNGMMIAAPKPGDHVKIQPIYDTPSGYGRP